MNLASWIVLGIVIIIFGLAIYFYAKEDKCSCSCSSKNCPMCKKKNKHHK